MRLSVFVSGLGLRDTNSSMHTGEKAPEKNSVSKLSEWRVARILFG